MIQTFRYLCFASIILYLASMPLAGVWHYRIEDNGAVTRESLTEPFLYLTAISVFLTTFATISYYVKYLNVYMKIGIAICDIVLILFAIMIIAIDCNAIRNDFNWLDGFVLVVLASVPASILFAIGLLIFMLGLLQSRKFKTHLKS
ncbi:MAG: hypothetical protein AB9866_16115 [Syntrophobacteraceae bacterium]